MSGEIGGQTRTAGHSRRHCHTTEGRGPERKVWKPWDSRAETQGGRGQGPEPPRSPAADSVLPETPLQSPRRKMEKVKGSSLFFPSSSFLLAE